MLFFYQKPTALGVLRIKSQARTQHTAAARCVPIWVKAGVVAVGEDEADGASAHVGVVQVSHEIKKINFRITACGARHPPVVIVAAALEEPAHDATKTKAVQARARLQKEKKEQKRKKKISDYGNGVDDHTHIQGTCIVNLTHRRIQVHKTDSALGVLPAQVHWPDYHHIFVAITTS